MSRKYYKPKPKNEKALKDTAQVGLANVSAIGLSMAQVNEILTFVSLVLAILFTIYKFTKFNA